jgi:hypothetical protein
MLHVRRSNYETAIIGWRWSRTQRTVCFFFFSSLKIKQCKHWKVRTRQLSSTTLTREYIMRRCQGRINPSGASRHRAKHSFLGWRRCPATSNGRLHVRDSGATDNATAYREVIQGFMPSLDIQSTYRLYLYNDSSSVPITSLTETLPKDKRPFALAFSSGIPGLAVTKRPQDLNTDSHGEDRQSR